MQIKGKVKILIDPGYDLFETAPGTSFDFSNTPLPAGFFGPGSQPYGGVIPLQGTPLGYFHGKATGETDTIVQRLDPIELHTPTSQAQVPIEIVALSLQSAQPITVHNGTGTEKWDVSVGLSPTASPKGSMTIHGHDKQGGTFDSTLPVLPKLTFSRLGDRKQVTLDVGKLPVSSPRRSGLDLRAHHVHYTYDAAGRLLTIHGLNQGFCAGCTRTSGRRFSEKSRLAKHKVHVPDRLARVPKGFDIFQTQPTKTSFTVPKSFSIPAGFFAPGSKPFSGEIKFEGVPIGTFHGKDVGDADTVVQRKRNAHVGPGDGKATIPIELVQLHLQSTEPIKVKVGSSTELWDVSATVSHKRQEERERRYVQLELPRLSAAYVHEGLDGDDEDARHGRTAAAKERGVGDRLRRKQRALAEGVPRAGAARARSQRRLLPELERARTEGAHRRAGEAGRARSDARAADEAAAHRVPAHSVAAEVPTRQQRQRRVRSQADGDPAQLLRRVLPARA
ncbi:MAG: hypothetical protein E6G00_01025, partial [Actinobacteria bacterium]